MSTLVTTDVDSMEAGPEMNALIQRDVLGRAECSAWTLQRVTEAGPIYFKLVECRHGACGPMGWIPPYSTNDATALEIAKELIGEDGSFSLNHFEEEFDDQPGQQWASTFVDGAGDEDIGYGPTIAIAICRAALKSVQK